MCANRHAVALGKRNKGKAKIITPARRTQLVSQMERARTSRWVYCRVCGMAFHPDDTENHGCGEDWK